MLHLDSVTVPGKSIKGDEVARTVTLAPEDVDDEVVGDFFPFFNNFFSLDCPDEEDDALVSGPSETLSAESLLSVGSM